MDGGGVGYTGIFQAKRNNRANGEPGVVVPPFQLELPPPVVKAAKVSMLTRTAGPRMLFPEASSVELLFLVCRTASIDLLSCAMVVCAAAARCGWAV